ncbi:hypothetical protein ABOM_009052 [Aspergillus bombycis]|uniref:Uncharacterized protein n=1 Tax=Aspergillus bombycis TaxID=109264 RepID=A0A1F7ZT36_9EURO|nr:hypothetical protein ABOM_009052 [Aspergillus bombycis]OGM42245.1 hypothetical protein ABOM_009052 [Aspergillus bombycis]
MEKISPRNYEPVPKVDNNGGDSGDGDTTLTMRPRRRSVQQLLKRNLATVTITGLLLTLLLLVIALIAAITLQPVRQALSLEYSPVYSSSYQGGQRQCFPTAPRTRLSCGNSTEEAEALDCRYDPLSACWLHRECPHDYVKEFTEFNNGQPFIYYYDKEMTRQMKDYDEVGRNVNGFYWTSNREHLVHCLYLLRRAHDVHMRGDRLDTMLADRKHTDHCTNMLANWLRRPDPALDELGTQGQTHCFMSCS